MVSIVKVCRAVVRTLFRILRAGWSALAILFLVLSLLLNIAVFSTGVLATAVATAVETVTGGKTVLTLLRDESGKVAALEKQAVGREAKLALAVEEKAALQSELVAARAGRKVVIDGAERSVEDAVQVVTRRVKARTAKLASTDLAATFGQSIPWVGVAVVVAATTYDLTSACETMTDMHALDVAFNPSAANSADVTEVCGLRVPSKEEVWQTIKSSPAMAWDAAKSALDGLPDLPDIGWPEMPDIDWTFWN